MSYTFQQFGSVLEQVIEQKFSKQVEKKIKNIHNDIDRIDDIFFPLLGQKIIAKSTFEGLGQFTPVWKGLTEKYTDRRSAKKKSPNPASNLFFQYSNRLQADLNTLGDGIAIFGSPLVKYKRGSLNQGDRGEIVYTRQTQTGKLTRNLISPDGSAKSMRRLIKDGISAYIVVNPFSKIPSGGKGRINIDIEDYLNTGVRKKVGYKLGNTRISPNSRPVINPYLNWWLETKIKTIVKKRLS